MLSKTIFINKQEKELYHNGDESKRFILSVEGESPLLIIGLNPSTASDQEGLDHTMRKLVKFIELSNKFDSFIMINLYPQRTKNPKELHEKLNEDLLNKNLSKIQTLTQDKKDVTVLAAWGNKINLRDYLYGCLLEIINLLNISSTVTWLKINEELTLKGIGHPFHPRNPSYKVGLHPFDITKYINSDAFKYKSN